MDNNKKICYNVNRDEELVMSIENKDLRGKLMDHGIKYDYSKLPVELIEIIRQLEEYDRLGDWFNYDIKFDLLEVVAKSYVISNDLDECEYQILLHKYGGLYDVDI